MISDADDAANSFRRALKKVGEAWHISANILDSASTAMFGDRSSETIAENRLDTFLRATRTNVVGVAPNVSIDELLRRYFDGGSPFGQTAHKKHEFPDPFGP